MGPPGLWKITLQPRSLKCAFSGTHSVSQLPSPTYAPKATRCTYQHPLPPPARVHPRGSNLGRQRWHVSRGMSLAPHQPQGSGFTGKPGGTASSCTPVSSESNFLEIHTSPHVFKGLCSVGVGSSDRKRKY